MMAIDLQAIRAAIDEHASSRICLSMPACCDVGNGQTATELLHEVERLLPVERELTDLRADIAVANPGDAIYQHGNEIRHKLGWSLLHLASALGLIDSDGDDCPKPKEYGGAEELLKLVSAEALRLKAAEAHARTGWISVTDRLPEPNVGVLVMLERSAYDLMPVQCLAYIVEHDRIGIDKPNAGPWRALWIDPKFAVSSEPTVPVVTHWMPLPAPPSAAPNAPSAPSAELDCSCIADFVAAGGVIRPGVVIPCPHVGSYGAYWLR